MIRVVAFAAALAAGPAVADTIYCSTSFQGYTVCNGPDGYRSMEWRWQDRVIGDDNRGNQWSTSRWRDGEITTVTPGPDR
jgi:hypothetical protein